jgi:hypothetical protein
MEGKIFGSRKTRIPREHGKSGPEHDDYTAADDLARDGI